MAAETVVVVERLEVDARLAELGLSVEELREILERAHLERSACTELDPISLPGNIFWGRTIRFARETYKQQGWKTARPKLVELLINPKGNIALTACSGDRKTGLPDKTPTSRYGKGPAMAERVRTNEQLVLDLMPVVQPLVNDDDAYADVQTWCLLYFHDTIDEERIQLRCEVSLPRRIEDRGKIDSWIERIILPPLELSGPLALSDEDLDGGPGTDIDVPIERYS